MGTDQKNVPILLGALRSALQRLQEQEELPADDPALRGIKSSILRTFARRERENEAEERETAA